MSGAPSQRTLRRPLDAVGLRSAHERRAAYGRGVKKTGAGNLFTVFGEPDIAVKIEGDVVLVELLGVDVYDRPPARSAAAVPIRWLYG